MKKLTPLQKKVRKHLKEVNRRRRKEWVEEYIGTREDLEMLLGAIGVLLIIVGGYMLGCVFAPMTAI